MKTERSNIMSRNLLIRAAALLLSLFTVHSSHFAFAQWIEQVPILQASDEADEARFGGSVAVDGNVAVVGAFAHHSGGTYRGQAYVYRHNGATWVEEQVLQASDETDNASFGFSVAVSGNAVVVGANGHPSGGSFRGQAYVYRHNGATWVQEQILQASDEVNGANFGNSVAVEGKVAVIGAWNHLSGGSERGQAYVYRYNGATWVQEQILQASDEVNSANFGTSVAVDGNVAVVGAYNHPSGGSQHGQAYTFRYNGAIWSEEQILQASDEVVAAHFGDAVAVNGNVAIVGALYHSSGGSSRGQAYVYRHNGVTWSEEQILQASDEVNSASFGGSVAVNGSLVVVGAFVHPSGGSGRGQAYVYRYNGVSWPEEQILQASDEMDDAQFGLSVTVDGSMIAVGAYLNPSGGSNRGQAYVFYNPPPNVARNWKSYE